MWIISTIKLILNRDIYKVLLDLRSSEKTANLVYFNSVLENTSRSLIAINEREYIFWGLFVLLADALSCNMAHCPCSLQVETTRDSIHIGYLTGEIESFVILGLQCFLVK